MIVSGDEIGRTQKGNNNAYCQDNEISWVDWKNTDRELLAFTQKLVNLRKKHPNFRRRNWFRGQRIKGAGVEDIAWFLPSAVEMSEENWNHDFAKSLGIFLNGSGIQSVGPKGDRVIDNNFYIMFNGHYEPLQFVLPPKKYGTKWVKILDTHENFLSEAGQMLKPGQAITIESRSIILLKHPKYKTTTNARRLQSA